ncbi:MAG TPA: hypothetical protein VMR16_00470 [Candidatus Saccharimonadales bacterium]|nr:hypothetical protein [Candidatus Saccharimonadales bacterium]
MKNLITMKRIKNFLGNPKKVLKEKLAARKKRVANEKQNKLYKERLNRGLDELGVSKVERGYGYLRYSNNVRGMTRQESLEKALYDEAVARGNKGAYGRALKAAMATEPLQPPTPRKYPVKRVLRWLGVAVVVVLVLWLLSALFSSEKKVTIINDNPTVTTSSDSLQCNNSWMMESIPANPKDNKWFEDGVAEIWKANQTKNPDDAKAAFNAWMERVKLNHNQLVATGKALLPENMSNFDETTISPDGSCANDATIQLVHEIGIAVIGQGNIVAANAPTNGFNTGIENGMVVGSATPGISGDLRAIQITFRDGRKVWVMARCGNPVTLKEVFKHGKTDEHGDHHKDQPKCTKNCKPKPPLTPKSSNPKDYKQPGDDNTRDSGTGTKPKATVSTPAESTPPTVNTSKSGGGGVIDTPTNKPGSETGTTANGASPAPSAPSTPKPNEGGSNNGVVTD